jgi:hypothetical protein
MSLCFTQLVADVGRLPREGMSVAAVSFVSWSLHKGSNTSLVARWRLEGVQDQIVACLTPLCIHSLREDQQKDATTHSKSKHKAEAARRRCELLLEAFRWAENAIWLAIPPTNHSQACSSAISLSL